MHVFELKPQYMRPNDNDNRQLVFYQMLHKSEEFGILSTKPMPNLPAFPIFLNVGELQVKVVTHRVDPIKDKSEIETLRNFHNNVFDNLLQVVKEFTVADFANQENSFLCVPGKIYL